jgi:hypothetical protein
MANPHVPSHVPRSILEMSCFDGSQPVNFDAAIDSKDPKKSGLISLFLRKMYGKKNS